MKFLNHFATLTLTACLLGGSACAFAACDTPGSDQLPYASELLSAMDNPAADYNSNLFYVNSLEFEIADPSVIYITEGKDKGWFYAYGTSDEINCHGFMAWRSKDLSHWECTGIALEPDFVNSWATDNYWAPEVIYDAEDKLYYMFYNAYNRNDSNRLWLSVAYSETPDGPFLAPTGRNNKGEPFSVGEPVFDVTVANPVVASRAREMEAAGVTNFAKANALDASPFIDPQSGEKYLYFSYHDDWNREGSFIYGMKMFDWYNPDYSSMTRLTHPGYSTVQRGIDRETSDRTEAYVNEGPFMIYHNGKYYLTLSVFGYTVPQYHVIQAVADSPLGLFTKVDEDRGGKVISSDVANWNHIVSAGHHSFITVGDELFIAYHTFKNRLSIDEGRALALDKVVWTTNSDGLEVMHTNGPTWSVQPLPASLSGYRNIAPDAELTASATAAGSDAALLTDGMIKYQEFDLAQEYEANPGKSVFTLKWDSPKTVRGIMIYNSYDYFKAFDKIDKLEIEYLKGNGSTAKLTLSDIPFDKDWFFEEEWEFIRPGGSAIAEFNELPVKSISVTIDGLAFNEIVVLGKDTPCAGVDSFPEYTYSNPTYGSSHIERDSRTFGTIEIDGKPSSLETMYGYDLSHDDGTADAYITQSGSYDQYAYFKGVYSTKFYVEATFTVPSTQSFAGDPFPKFGLVVSCDEMATNSIFYYVDADPTYTNRRVGCAQRMLDNSNWSWADSEHLKDAPGISYRNGNTVQLAVLRDGSNFHFFYNGQFAMTVNDFNVFTAYQRAGVGFLTFNTPLRITGYSATADEAAVSAKLQQFGLN